MTSGAILIEHAHAHATPHARTQPVSLRWSAAAATMRSDAPFRSPRRCCRCCCCIAASDQYGDPTNVEHFVIVSVSCAVAPKSASLTWPERERRMF